MTYIQNDDILLLVFKRDDKGLTKLTTFQKKKLKNFLKKVVDKEK